MRDPLQEFRTFNRLFARRNPELLRHKIARMAESPFAFFRGAFHLFARDVLGGVGGPLPLFHAASAELDLVGDLHSENYGTFKADDGKVHYDVNDFDETTTGRFDFDICRLATSHFLASRDRGDTLAKAVQVSLGGILAYTTGVRKAVGKAKGDSLDIREGILSGSPAIDALVTASAAVKRPAFINRLTEIKSGHRRLLRSARYFNLADSERDQALRLLEDYRRRHADLPEKGDFFSVEDVCGRVSGIGSMGRLRYVILFAGKGSADARNVLLEFKEARPSAYDLYRDRDIDDAALVRRAERVVTVQRLSQAAANRFLGFAVDGKQSFQVRELGPHDARVEAKTLDPGGVDSLATVQAEILARIHARSAARAVGPANPLAELADPDAFCQRVLAFALSYSDVVRGDWTRFVGARAELDRVEEWMSGDEPR
jgi:uncharacterized protein (DUF2252 family)